MRWIPNLNRVIEACSSLPVWGGGNLLKLLLRPFPSNQPARSDAERFRHSYILMKENRSMSYQRLGAHMRIFTLIIAILGFQAEMAKLYTVHAVSSDSPDTHVLASSEATPQNGLLREVYLGIPGQDLGSLTNHAKYPDNPDSTDYVTEFEAPINVADQYGQRLRGFIVPPQTGEYVFWVAGDDNSALYLSTDETPANLQLIAQVPGWTSSREWEKYSQQESAPIQLQKDQTYYVEALMKEEGGGDNLAVRWRLPDNTLEEPIPQQRLLPFGVSFTPPEITQQPQDQATVENELATFSVEVSNLDPVTYQWQRDDIDIQGATSRTLSIPFTPLEYNGSQFRCVLNNRLGTTVSRSATLSVSPDVTPPSLVAAQNLGTGRVVVTFSEPVDAANGANPDHYQLDNGVQITIAEVRGDGTSVELSTSPLTIGTQYTLSVSNVRDRAETANTIPSGSQLQFTAVDFQHFAIGDPDSEGTTLPVENGYRITGSASGIGGTSDQFHYGYQQRTGSFDVKVRVASLDNTDPWATAGLMLRNELTAGSPFAAVFATPSINGTMFSFRDSSESETKNSDDRIPINYPYTWLRLQRSGNTFTGYGGFDGRSWKELGSVTFDAPDTVFFGMTVDSQLSTASATALFQDLNEVQQESSALFSLPSTEPPGPSSRLTGLTITEIMYHPPARDDGLELEFVEIFNSQEWSEEISGHAITGDIEFTFPEGTSIPSGGYIVIAKNPDDIESVYGIQNVYGPYAGDLPNNNGDLAWRHANGGILVRVNYSDRIPPWPASADGAGHTLVLQRPSFGTLSPKAWGPSSMIGGSPGQIDPFVPDPLQSVVINEFLAHTDDPQEDFIELYNLSRETLDLSGARLSDDPDTRGFTIPSGISIPPFGFLHWTQSELGFALNSGGEFILFFHPNGSRVLDSVQFTGQDNGVSTGRFPDGGPGFQELSSLTPGSPNATIMVRPIVINELMFHPPFENDDHEFVELLNTSEEPVDLSGWRFIDGIDLQIPEGISINPNGFLVIAKNKEQLLQAHPDLSPDHVLGNYEGVLADGGERIALARPDINLVTNANNTVETNIHYVVMDEVTYRDGGRWGTWADGGGSSLELIDPRSDNRRAFSWAVSDETGKSEWTTIEHTGVLDHGQGDLNELHVMILGDGEALIDNLEVMHEGAGNLVPNSTLESGFNGWVAEGNHVHSSLSSAGSGFNSDRSIHLRASGGGDNGANRIEIDLSSRLTAGRTGTIRADVRWLKGHPDILLRLHGNHLEAVGTMKIPANLGTPGAPNSQARSNNGPAIFNVSHTPVLPSPNESVTVTARLHDPDGIQSVRLRYRVDPGTQFFSVTMNDNGEQGDAKAGDGLWSGQIPGQSSGQLIAFHIQATDNADTQTASTSFPQKTPERECLIRFGDPSFDSSFGVYRMWMTQANVNEWSSRPNMSNEALDGTLVYGNGRVIYNASARYRGSPFIRPRYNSPEGSLCAYIFNTPKDDRLLGADEFNLDWLEQPGRDPSLQRERTSFWIAEQLGLPFTYQRYIHIVFNGRKRGEVYTDSQQVNGDFIEGWFPGDDEGEIFKIDDWFEFNDGEERQFNVDATLQVFTTTGGEKKKARYRWNWEKKANRGLNDSYSSLFQLVDAVNATGSEYTQAVESIVDVDQWMGIFGVRHIVADWDGYGYNRGKNQFAYKPQRDRWKMLLWDLDFSLGGGSHGPTADLFSTSHPAINRMYNHPPFRRAYLQVMDRAVKGPLTSEAMSPVTRAVSRAFTRNNVDADGDRSLLTWVAQRRNYIEGVVNNNNVPFEISTNGGNDLSTANNTIMLQGRAPIPVKSIQVNGVKQRLHWTTVNTWQLQLALHAGANQLTVQGFDFNGQDVENASDSITITFSGEDALPQDHVVINELMYHPAENPNAEFLELFNSSTTHSFDLSGYRFNGLSFIVPDGILIGPEEYLVFTRDPLAFQGAFGANTPFVATYPGALDNVGEKIQLLKPSTGDEEEVIVDEVRYAPADPWPTRANGQGPSLQLIDPQEDNRRVANWRAAALPTDPVDAPVRVVELDHEWNYNQSGQDLGTAWREPDFNDRSWNSGRALLYVEGSSLPGPKNTPLDLGQTTYYFRTTFTNPFAADVNLRLMLETVIDDGAIVYLNGEEIYRLGMPSGPVDATTFANRTVSNAQLEGPVEIFSDALQPGENVLAVEVHQTNATSSDIVMGLTLELVPQVQGPYTPGSANSVAADLPPFPMLWINEIQPRNASGAVDNAGDPDPWVELYNAGTSTISLEGYFFSNQFTNLTQWAFPSGTEIQPNGFLLVWLDAEPEQTVATELHANFQAAPVAGSISLNRNISSRMEVLDYLHYNNIETDRSHGLYPDGVFASETHFFFPTPAAPNTLETPETQVFINEWLAINDSILSDPADGAYSDWFELYNPGDSDADLSGFTLTDDLNDPQQFVIPQGTVVPAGGFLLVWADNDPEQNSSGPNLHVNFALSGGGESIGLFKPGGSVLDSITFEPQTSDVSEGRFPDGAEPPFVSMSTPTPGQPNILDTQEEGPLFILDAFDIDPSGVVHLEWEATPGVAYRVQYKNALSDPQWVNLEDVVAGGEIASVNDPTAGESSKRFYRILVLP